MLVVTSYMTASLLFGYCHHFIVQYFFLCEHEKIVVGDLLETQLLTVAIYSHVIHGFVVYDSGLVVVVGC